MGGSSIFGAEDRREGGVRSSEPKLEDGQGLFRDESAVLRTSRGYPMMGRFFED